MNIYLSGPVEKSQRLCTSQRLSVVGTDPDNERLLARAEDSRFSARALMAAANAESLDVGVFNEARSFKDFGLLAMDMDSTLITIECIDEIADYAGKKAEVAAITEAAMRGEIADYAESLRQRVALLSGLPVNALERVFDERLRLNPGASALIAAAKAAGLKLLLVSGGFTYFTDRLKLALGLDRVEANHLDIENDRLLGTVRSPIVDAVRKRVAVEVYARELGLSPSQVIAVGDGANDLEMMSYAGLSVAYHAKPRVREKADQSINYGGLNVLSDWLTPFDDTVATSNG